MSTILGGDQANLYEDRSRASGPHPLFAELSRVNSRFDRFYVGLMRPRRIDEYMEEGRECVQAYIDEIEKHRGEITPAMLCQRENVFKDNLDPVFAFLIRAMCGSATMNEEVYAKVRKAWCGDDIPDSLGDLLKITNDDEFLAAFNSCDLHPVEQVKLTVLRRMGVMESLMQKRRAGERVQ